MPSINPYLNFNGNATNPREHGFFSFSIFVLGVALRVSGKVIGSADRGYFDNLVVPSGYEYISFAVNRYS